MCLEILGIPNDLQNGGIFLAMKDREISGEGTGFRSQGGGPAWWVFPMGFPQHWGRGSCKNSQKPQDFGVVEKLRTCGEDIIPKQG